MSSIVDQIRKALEKQDGVSEEVMEPLAAAYAEAVERVNSRLSEAVALLRKGLRSEAIQQVSMTPDALQSAANLDFPEVGDWLDILQFLGVAVPPTIDHDATLQINEAIVETQPLNALLKRQRKLAIAKAPLVWRLKVLRRIAQVDEMNPVWEEDVEKWEEARLKQIPTELAKAISDEDVQKLAAIRDELTLQSWRVNPSEKLIQEAQEASDRLAFDEHVRQLRSIAPGLHDAFGQFDEPQARMLRDRWHAESSELKMPVPVDLADQVAPAMAWLDGLDQQAASLMDRKKALGNLQSVLDRNESTNKLHRAYQLASRFDEPIPVELENRYRVLIAEHNLRSKRKTQGVIAAVMAVTIITVAAIGLTQYRAYQQKQIAAATDQMQKLLAENKLSEAQRFWDRLSSTQSELIERAEMASLVSQLHQRVGEENARAEQFNQYLANADKPEASEIDVEWLEKAESIAKGEDEKASAFAVRRRYAQWERDVETQQSSDALKTIDAIAREANEIENKDATSESIQSITQLIDKLDQLATKFPRRSSASESQRTVLRSRTIAMRDAIRQQILTMRVREEAVKRILDSKSLAAFGDNLEAFTREVPNSVMAKEFSSVANERALWDLPMDSNAMMRELRASVADGISPSEATQLIASYEKVTQAVVGSDPILRPIAGIEETMNTITQREAILDKVFDDLSLLVISELVTLEVPDPNTPSNNVRFFLYSSYYDQNRAVFSQNKYMGVEVVVNASAAVKRTSFPGPLIVNQEPRKTVRYLLEKKSEKEFMFLSDWSGTFLETMSELRSRPELDGFVKEIIFQKLLEGAVSGSEWLSEQLAPSLQLLKRRKEQRNRWFAGWPINSSLAEEVERLVVPEISEAYRKRDQEWEKIRGASRREYSWVGCLLRNESGNITTYISEDAPTESGTLYVVRPSLADPTKAEFNEVGKWKGDHVVLGSTQIDLVAGRPLFFLPDLVKT